MEPPRTHVPGHADAAAIGAFGLAVVGHGPVGLLALAAGLALASPAGFLAGALALVATGIRWGSGWLVAVGGAQAVLGPAVGVGPVAGAASTWLAAASLVVATPPNDLVAAGVGAAAGFVASGPAGVGGIGWRVVGTLAGIAAAAVASRLPRLRLRTLLAVAAGAAAVGMAGLA